MQHKFRKSGMWLSLLGKVRPKLDGYLWIWSIPSSKHFWNLCRKCNYLYFRAKVKKITTPSILWQGERIHYIKSSRTLEHQMCILIKKKVILKIGYFGIRHCWHKRFKNQSHSIATLLCHPDASMWRKKMGSFLESLWIVIEGIHTLSDWILAYPNLIWPQQTLTSLVSTNSNFSRPQQILTKGIITGMRLGSHYTYVPWCVSPGKWNHKCDGTIPRTYVPGIVFTRPTWSYELCTSKRDYNHDGTIAIWNYKCSATVLTVVHDHF